MNRTGKITLHRTIARILLFSIGIMLSCSLFAAKPEFAVKPVFAAKPPMYAIGDTGPGGGIIFHISDDGRHGLEAAQNDLSGRSRWRNGFDLDTNALKTGINDGSFNTDRIIITQGGGFYAALRCANLNDGGYGDWYLPSRDELDLMYHNLHLNGLGGFADDYYWSSSEFVDAFAYSEDFTTGAPSPDVKAFQYRVRAVRAF